MKKDKLDYIIGLNIAIFLFGAGTFMINYYNRIGDFLIIVSVICLIKIEEKLFKN